MTSHQLTRMLARFRRCQRGAISIEYGLIAVVLSVSVIALVRDLPVALSGFFESAAQNLQAQQ